MASEAFGRGPGRKPPPREHGVYLFTESGRHLYVGRCGLTERAAKRGRGHSSFRTRLAGHTRPSSGHNQATFAWRLAIEAVDGRFEDLPTVRAELQRDSRFRQEVLRQKERVTAMDFQVVILAITIQNIPEGTSVAIPMEEAGFGRGRQFWAAVATSSHSRWVP